MAKRYSIDGQANNDVDDTILALISATTIKPKIYEINLGSDATPADNAASYHLQRFSAVGTSTAVTPRPLDPDDPAAQASAGENHTVEPTYTADLVLLNWAQNQRATFRWVAAPESEIILPALANNGVGVRTVAVGGSPVNTVCTIHYKE